MDEQRRDLIHVVEDEAVSPRNHCTRKRSVREAITCEEHGGARWKDPDVYEIEDVAVVAEVEEEIVPGALLVLVPAEGDEVGRADRVCEGHILRCHAKHQRGEEDGHDTDEE